ncbi:MAG: error-prone DNA polymerase, partial [Acidimicrobiales bacterium]
TGTANAIVWPKVFEALRRVVIGARFIAVTGRVQIESGVIHIVTERAEDLTPLLTLLSSQGEEISSIARADEVKRPNDRGSREAREKIQPNLFADAQPTPSAAELRRVLPKGRNFQ